MYSEIHPLKKLRVEKDISVHDFIIAVLKIEIKSGESFLSQIENFKCVLPKKHKNDLKKLGFSDDEINEIYSTKIFKRKTKQILGYMTYDESQKIPEIIKELGGKISFSQLHHLLLVLSEEKAVQ